MTSALHTSLAIVLTAENSPLLVIGKPASIESTPNSSRANAILNLSSGFNATPGVCSPSLNVVSNILTYLLEFNSGLIFTSYVAIQIPNSIEGMIIKTFLNQNYEILSSPTQLS